MSLKGPINHYLHLMIYCWISWKYINWTGTDQRSKTDLEAQKLHDLEDDIFPYTSPHYSFLMDNWEICDIIMHT